MGLRNLSVDNMAEITGSWISEHRELFLSIPEVAGLLPHVEAAHAKVLALAHHAQNTELARIINAERTLDRRHDHIYRAFYYLGKAWSEYVLSQEKVDEDLLERVQATIGTLLPKGLNSVQNPFAQEGDARLAQDALGNAPDIKSTLSELRLTDSVAAVDMLESWFALAEELGALERKKEQLTDSLGSKTKPINSRVCRNEWTKIVTSVLTALDYSEADPEKIRALRAPLNAAVQNSTMRYIEGRRGKKSA